MNVQSKIIQELEQIKNVDFAYIFGSYAQGTETSRSDIDVAVYLLDGSLDNILETTYLLSKNISCNVDVVVLNTVKNLYLLDAIFKDGILVKDGEHRIDFELRKEHDILDFKQHRAVIDAA